MGRKGLQAIPILLLVLTMVCNILGAPVKEHVPPHAKSVALPSHITKGDVMLLKEKLAELEADLDQLEPVVPADTTADDDEEDEVDIEPLEETDEEEEIVPPAETEQDNPAPVEQQPPKAAVPAENEMETDPVVEHPEEVEDDDEDDEDDEEQDEEEDAGEGGQTEDVEETEGEWEEEEAVNEGIMPFVDPEEDDLYLRKLIVQALTVLYRKDADRIDRMLQQYEDKLIGDDVFEENIAPAPQDLMPNNAMGGQKLEASAFADRPYTNEELHDEEVLQAMASKKRQDMNVAEHTLLSDMHTFEGKGITLDELLNDLEDKKNNDGQGLLVEPRNEARDELDEEEDALFGEYKEDAVVVDNEEAAAADEDPALSLQELQEIDNEGVNDAGHEVDDADEEGPDDLLMELMANLNTSLKKFQENKASPQ